MEPTEQLTDEQKIEHQIAVRDNEGALSVVEQSNALVVKDIATKEQSVGLEKQAKLEKKRDLEFLDPFVKAKHEAHKKATTTKANRIAKYDEVIKAEGSKRATWTLAKNERLTEEANERAKVEAAERTERLKAIQATIFEATAQATDTEENMEILRLMLDEEGVTDEKAELIRSQITVQESILAGVNRQAAEEAAEAQMAAAAPQSPPAASIAPKSKGEVMGWGYTVTVTSMKELCKAISEGKVPVAAVKAAQGKLNGYAKDEMELPGCHITKEPTSHTRG